jgi:hypothetical protein
LGVVDAASRVPSGSGGLVGEGLQRLAAGEPLVHVVPEADRRLAGAPAQPDLAARHERREVDQPGGDVAEHDVALVQPRDVGLHLVHDPAHPQPEPTELRVGVRVVALGQLVDDLAEDDALAVPVRVAQPDELVALLAQAARDDGQVRDQRVGGVERVEAGHRGIVPRDRRGPIRAQCAVG